jgi:hypothetical protein
MIGKIWNSLLLATLAVFAGVGWLAYYLRYHLWVDCFNELGRCFDPDGSGQVYTDAAISWAYIAGIFTILTLLSAWRLRRRFHVI